MRGSKAVMFINLSHYDEGARIMECRTEGEQTMKMWLRCGLLALCTAALMATTTLADGIYSLKVSEINGVPISLGKACCEPGTVCTPDVVGAPCVNNSECTVGRQIECADVVCAFGNPAHCPVGNSTCQIFAGGNFCTLPTVLNAGEVAPGDILRVEAYFKGWDALPNTGLCPAADAVGTCTIVPDTCDFKTICDENSGVSSGSDCNATRICTTGGFCQGLPDILCTDDTVCANISCRGGLCILNECQVTPLATTFQWSFDVPSFSSGSNGSFAIDSAPNSVFIDKNRPDYIFFGQESWNFTSILNTVGFLEFASVLDTGNPNATPVLDVGEEKYIGTMMLTPSANAAGIFTLDFSPSASVNTFNNEIGNTIVVTDLRPLVITMGGCTPTPTPQSWTSIGQHGSGCTFNPGCGGNEYGQNMPANNDYSEPRSTGINKIVVTYDIDVDVSNAVVTVDGCDADGFTQDTSSISMTVVPGANPNEAVMMFSPSLPGNNPQIGEIPVKYDITISGVDCVGGGSPITDETRTAWAIFGDANPTPITVNNGDLGFVRSARDIILARPAGQQVVDPNSPTGMFEIRADINNDNTVSNGDLGLVRVARDSITQPTGLCP